MVLLQLISFVHLLAGHPILKSKQYFALM